MTKHKVATGLILSYMEHKGFYGWTSFWDTVYYRTEEHMNTSSLRQHELQHIAQINELGCLKFMVMYMYYDYKYGYHDNPFEVEARAAE